MTDRPYLVQRYQLTADQAEQCATDLMVAGYTAFTRESAANGDEMLTCYGSDGSFPAAVDEILANLSPLEEAQSTSEAELLQGLTGDDPYHLCAHIAVDPLGRGRICDKETLSLHIPTSAAFGDGRHPTTRLASAFTQQIDWHGKSAVDVGCGTGVLGLIALKAGASDVTFSDYDADAVRTCDTVLRLNGMNNWSVAQGDLLQPLAHCRVDAVLANLYGELVTDMLASPLLNTIMPHGYLALSGVSETKIPIVKQALVSAGFTIVADDQEGWWYGCLAQR